jgi:hypothetical protein
MAGFAASACVAVIDTYSKSMNGRVTMVAGADLFLCPSSTTIIAATPYSMGMMAGTTMMAGTAMMACAIGQS